MNYRTIFISDIHIGSTHSNVEAVLNFLKKNEAETIYLCGDIFDFLVIKKSYFMSELFNTFIQKILRKARNGTKIVYIPGNHDELMRKFDEHVFGNISIHKEYIHKTKKAKRIKIIHGDEFDIIFKSKQFFYAVGAVLYSSTLFADKFIRRFKKDFSCSFYFKRKVKDFFEKITDYYRLLIKKANESEVDGIISGHTHLADLSLKNGIIIGNCGCWMADTINTCIVENIDGDLSLLTINSEGQVINEKILVNN